MKETTLLSVALKSRSGFGVIKQHLDIRAHSREFQAVFAAIEDYYLRDGGAQHTDPAVVTAVVCDHLHNHKHKEKFAAFIAEAALIDVSVPNVAFMVLKAKREELGNKIALKLANDEDAMELIEEFRLLNSVDSLDALTASDAVVLEFKDVQAIVDDVVNNVGTLKLYPNALNDRLDGRLGPGHHVEYYGVPEIGKTALSVTFSCGFCSQDQPGLYFINEDPERDIYMRHLSCMSGMPYAQIKESPAKAIKIAESRGLENVRIIGISPGNIKQIDAFVEKYDPKWVIIEQYINLNEKGDGLTQILGRAARGGRALAKRAGITVLGSCQGADSAAGKAVLDQGDVYMSNTEVPAQADLLIGIGGNADHIKNGIRILSLPKNKISGNHDPVTVKIHEAISRYSSHD